MEVDVDDPNDMEAVASAAALVGATATRAAMLKAAASKIKSTQQSRPPVIVRSSATPRTRSEEGVRVLTTASRVRNLENAGVEVVDV